jgi:hypothetical protein
MLYTPYLSDSFDIDSSHIIYHSGLHNIDPQQMYKPVTRESPLCNSMSYGITACKRREHRENLRCNSMGAIIDRQICDFCLLDETRIA